MKPRFIYIRFYMICKHVLCGEKDGGGIYLEIPTEAKFLPANIARIKALFDEIYRRALFTPAKVKAGC